MPYGERPDSTIGRGFPFPIALVSSSWMFSASFKFVLGADRQKFLNGQVTNNVKDLKTGEGCYAALVNAKGKIQSDLNIFLLEDEILLDFEPGYSAAVAQLRFRCRCRR